MLDRDMFRLDPKISRTQNFRDIMRDKFIALEQDKCHFVYQLCLAINAKNIVEAGTSFGVSTMYLALAISRNLEATGGKGLLLRRRTRLVRRRRQENIGRRRER